MKSTTVKKDLIPYRAGVAIVAPLDANKRPDFTKAVRTEPNFLTSTQTSVTSNVETLPNGNGQDKEYPLDETYTVTITSNTYSSTFHNTLANRIETLPDSVLVPDEFEYTLPLSVDTDSGDVLGIEFGIDADHEIEPGKDSNGNYNFIIQDSYGNNLVRLYKEGASMPTLENGTYYYDTDRKTLMFSEDYLGALIRVTYWHNDTKAIRYDSNPILSRPEFYIEMYGLYQSADDQTTYKVVTILQRAYVSGDLPDPTSQKSKSSPLTYTVTSAPVPVGTSVYTQIITPYTAGDTTVDTGTINACNGIDDIRVSKP